MTTMHAAPGCRGPGPRPVSSARVTRVRSESESGHTASGDHDLAQRDGLRVGDADAEVRSGADVRGRAPLFGERLEVEPGARLLDEVPPDRVERDGVGGDVHRLVGDDALRLRGERAAVRHELEAADGAEAHAGPQDVLR